MNNCRCYLPRNSRKYGGEQNGVRYIAVIGTTAMKKNIMALQSFSTRPLQRVTPMRREVAGLPIVRCSASLIASGSDKLGGYLYVQKCWPREQKPASLF